MPCFYFLKGVLNENDSVDHSSKKFLFHYFPLAHPKIMYETNLFVIYAQINCKFIYLILFPKIFLTFYQLNYIQPFSPHHHENSFLYLFNCLRLLYLCSFKSSRFKWDVIQFSPKQNFS